MTCGACKHWRQVEVGVPQIGGGAQGHCRRYPPKPFPLGVDPTTKQLVQANIMPIVPEEEPGCGEYTPKVAV